jgi:hypothetical protein
MRIFSFTALIVLCCGFSLLVQGQQTPIVKNVFDPPELVSAADIPYPFDSVAFGTVVFEVALDKSGTVEDVRAIRSIPSLTEPASKSIRAWKFHPAAINGIPVRSRTTVAVMFNPVNPPATNPLPPREAETSARLVLPPGRLAELESTTFAAQHMGAAMPRSVVLKAKVTSAGEIQDVTVVREGAPFTSGAMQALPKWVFTPAQFTDHPVDSWVAVAFVFRPPSVTSP